VLVAGNGSGYGAPWSHKVDGTAATYTQLSFAAFDAAGARLGSSTTVVSELSNAYAPRLILDGSGYGLAIFVAAWTTSGIGAHPPASDD
jgi:hypothetical protein